MRCVKDNPKPHPPALLLKPGRNTFFQSRFGIPLPVSVMVITTSVRSKLTSIEILPFAFSKESIPFLIRFSNAQESKVTLPRMTISFPCFGLILISILSE